MFEQHQRRPWMAGLLGLFLGVPAVNAAIPLDITNEGMLYVDTTAITPHCPPV